jgi:hypothetical protein
MNPNQPITTSRSASVVFLEFAKNNLACGAGVSIKPGVEQRNPGLIVALETSP